METGPSSQLSGERVNEILRRLATSFASELDPRRLAQRVIDEATTLTGASLGAFFHYGLEEAGERRLDYALAGVPASAFAHLRLPGDSGLLGSTLQGGRVTRCDDVREDPRYGKTAPHHGLPEGHPPVVSFLSVPLSSRSGEVLGGLFFGHPRRGAFTEAHERLIADIAALAAVALDNARLFQRLQSAEERLRLALEAGRMGYFDWSLSTGKVVISPGLQTLYGASPGHDWSFEGYLRLLHPEDRGWVGERIQRLIAQGGDGDAFAYRIVRADGAVRWIEGFSKLLRDEAGQAVRLLGIGLDATERIEASEKARRLEAQTRLAAYEALRADVSTALSGQGTLTAILQRCAEAIVRHLGASFARLWTLNAPAQLLELQASAGRYTHLDGPHARVPVGHLKIGAIALERQPLVTNDVQADPRIGDREWARREGMVAFAGFPLLVGAELIGVMAMFSTRRFPDDLHPALSAIADALAQGIERRRAENTLAARAVELARSNAELEQFAYVASHDLQEPLRMVASFTELLARRYKGQLDQKADRYIDFAVDGVTRMQRLIQDLLAFSRVGTRGQPPVPTDGQLALERALASLEAATSECGATISADPLPTVQADELQLEQLLQNLLANALKFRAPDLPPTIHVSARRREGEWVFSVRDNGIGIEPQYFERIFIIFQRLHAKNRYPGTGIGLAICKKIVERHGGRIWVESSPGQGSTFFFTLPAADSREGRSRSLP